MAMLPLPFAALTSYDRGTRATSFGREWWLACRVRLGSCSPIVLLEPAPAMRDVAGFAPNFHSRRRAYDYGTCDVFGIRKVSESETARVYSPDWASGASRRTPVGHFGAAKQAKVPVSCGRDLVCSSCLLSEDVKATNIVRHATRGRRIGAADSLNDADATSSQNIELNGYSKGRSLSDVDWISRIGGYPGAVSTDALEHSRGDIAANFLLVAAVSLVQEEERVAGDRALSQCQKASAKRCRPASLWSMIVAPP
ncbi:hypothetical protein K458DRAFT_448245 [Lentithecium fluviatile CBS 122367]|uniref:Uncharacterized protein n=1 Tax=Lentithecium fluviatile CBS 122367 TaxID=1168545 RepID=A0A6G1JN67_9PLEO|nr:hypothetical protein K458DRAFT_448245 [Lentithecium fluviatile CBS 122367]